MIRLLSTDLLIADVIIPLKENVPLQRLVEQYALKPGGKITLDSEQLAEFSAVTEGHAFTLMPGGSSANMLTTLAKLLGKQADIRFLGVIGEGIYGNIIKRSLNDVGITLLPKHLPAKPTPMSAVSFVLVFPDGQCTIATHPGNAKDLMKDSMISDDMVQESDVVLLQGSLWHKLDPAIPEKLLTLCQKYKKSLWLTLPTQAHFTAQDAAHFHTLIPYAHMLLGNDAELMRVFGAPLESALEKLQQAFKASQLSPLGFITFGKKGAAVMTKDTLDKVEAMSINPSDIANTLGAGDTSFAGFAAGHIKGLPRLTCAHIAMALAGEKLRINSPRLPDPAASLAKLYPDLAQVLRGL